MPLESATYIASLDQSNPPGTDKKKQGDDHIRLIKEVLKNSFPGASKAWYNPTSEVKTLSWSVASTEMNKTFLVSTAAGAVTATMPSLVSGDAGWECFFVKTTTDTNPIFIAPPSGTIQSGDLSGLAKTRRCIPGHRFRAWWTGSAWFVDRVARDPVGTVLDLPHGTSLPVGYEYANGQTLASASSNYPDFYSRNGSSGVVTDRRGRVAAGKGDMGGVADAARLTATYFGAAGTGLGNVGGSESHQLTQVQLPDYDLSSAEHTHTGPGNTTTLVDIYDGTSPGGGVSAFDNSPNTAPTSTGSGAIPSGGSDTPHNNVQPTIITNFIVVVE